jgi:glycerol-3-phosphate dehydrogenase
MLPEERARHAAPCHTKGTALAGLAPAGLATELEQDLGIIAEVADGMSRRLGALAWTAALLARKPRELTPLADGLDLSAAEVRAHLRYSAVLHLEDLLLRRARLGMWSPDRVHDLLPALRPLFADELGIGSRQWPRELDRLEQRLVAWTLAGACQEPAGARGPAAAPPGGAAEAVFQEGARG